MVCIPKPQMTYTPDLPALRVASTWQVLLEGRYWFSPYSRMRVCFLFIDAPGTRLCNQQILKRLLDER